MAKNLNSVSFTVLLFVLVMALTGFLKSEANDCGPGGCSAPASRVFHAECGPAPFLGTNADCCSCCNKLPVENPPVSYCWAAVEGTDKHCHCYKKV